MRKEASLQLGKEVNSLKAWKSDLLRGKGLLRIMTRMRKLHSLGDDSIKTYL